jgi:hypothetical protein
MKRRQLIKALQRATGNEEITITLRPRNNVKEGMEFDFEIVQHGDAFEIIPNDRPRYDNVLVRGANG